MELNQSTSKLAGKKITLSFVPATQADQNLINSYFPKAHADGSPIDPSELPKSLPGYLLKFKAEFRVEGQVIAQTTQSFTMGSDVKQLNQYFNPAKNVWEGGEDNDITVGEYNAIGLDLQGIGAKQIDIFKTKLELIGTKLTQYQQNPDDISPINGLTKEDITGNILQSGILGYFAQVDSSDRFAAAAMGNVTVYRLPSYGRFISDMQSHYFFGVARNVTFTGVVMDVDYLAYHVSANDASQPIVMQFMRQTGAAGSAAENSVPEMMFRNPNLIGNDPAQPQGVSAVKALALAAIQGQKVYTLNQKNHALHGVILAVLQVSQDVKLEIIGALTAGKEVVVHEKEINVNGWVGSGYIIFDQDLGAAAYKIAGGANGGAVNDSFIGRYLTWVSANMITADSPAIAATLLLVAPVMKSWFGFAPLLGSKNPSTTLIRALSLILRGAVGFGIPFAAGAGRLLWPIAFFIGIYNVTILLQGLFYAKITTDTRTRNAFLTRRQIDEVFSISI